MKNIIYTVVKELAYTFSTLPSFLSSKKLERALLITVALTLMCFFIFYNRHSLGPFEFLSLITPLFAYAGFNTVQGRIDKKLDAKTELSDKVVTNSTDLANKIVDNENT